MKYIGIDNGLSGGIAVIEDRKILEILPMPVVAGTKGKNELDILVIQNLLWKYRGVLIIEKAQAMPKQGSVSMFNYGKNYGIIIGLAVSVGMPTHYIPPKTWQKEMFVGVDKTDTKAASVQVAKQFYPTHAFLASVRSKVPHNGMTDAVLIATYGFRKNL